MVPVPSFDLHGRSALVTGGTRGIGRAIVQALHAAGATVAFTHADDAAQARALCATENAPAATLHAIDIAMGDPDAAGRIHAAACAALAAVDILVLNAWTETRQPLFELQPAAVEKQIQANFLDNLALATLCAEGMRRRRWGRILFIGSINQATPLATLPIYAALKCAMGSIVRSLAIALAPDNVTANTLLPGLVETERNAFRRVPGGDWAAHAEHSNYLRRGAQPQEIAGLALLLCAPAGAFCTGSEYWVDGGAHIPGKFHWQTPHERN